jgi:hypothetical protein
MKANFTDVVLLSYVKLKIKESRQIFSFTDRTNKFGARLSKLLLLHRPETDVTNEASVVKEDVLAEVTVQNFGVVRRAEVREQLVVVAVDA